MRYWMGSVVFLVAAIVEFKTGIIGRSSSTFQRATLGRESRPTPFIPRQITAAIYLCVAVFWLVRGLF